MKGEGFKALVKTGDTITTGQKLIEFDLLLVKKLAKSSITPIVITNMDKVKSMRVNDNDPAAVLEIVLK